MIRKSPLVFFITILCISISSSMKCKFNVEIKQSLIREGYHRIMTYNITFGDNKQLKNCIIGIEQGLPSGVYVNSDHLADLRRVNKTKALPKNRVNTEIMAELAPKSYVYVIGKVTDDVNDLWVPVHARYHKARPSGGVATNEVPPPTLYLKCPDERLHMCKLQQTTQVPFLCDTNTRARCEWKQIPYILTSDLVFWDVPIGNTDHYYVVSIGTALAVSLGSIYILRTIHQCVIKLKTKHIKTA